MPISKSNPPDVEKSNGLYPKLPVADSAFPLGHSAIENHSTLKSRTDPKGESNPNILLNLHYSSKITHLIFAGITGLVLQGAVLIWAAFVTYSTSVRYRVLDASVDATSYGFPLLAIGTILLTIGLIVAATVIEQSSAEKRWYVEQQGATSKKMYALWLQKKQSQGAQTFDSYVLQANNDCDEIFTSHPWELKRDSKG